MSPLKGVISIHVTTTKSKNKQCCPKALTFKRTLNVKIHRNHYALNQEIRVCNVPKTYLMIIGI